MGGVIYLHDISQDRQGYYKATERLLRSFNSLRDDATLDRVVLVTSKWERASGRNFHKREDELKDIHWKGMLNGGVCARYDRWEAEQDEKSTWRIVRAILDNVEAGVIEDVRSEGQRVQEFVRRNSLLPKSQADREWETKLGNLLEAQSKMLTLEADALAGNPRAKAQLPEAERKVNEISQEIERGKGSFSDLVYQWWISLLQIVKRA